ncbi:hypothetical protein VTH06DRAFT_4726 [Thermothelomyces fergusii]
MPTMAQKIMTRLPNGRGGRVRYPRKWATGAGREGRQEGGSKGLMYLSMSKCQRDVPRRIRDGGIMVAAVYRGEGRRP